MIIGNIIKSKCNPSFIAPDAHLCNAVCIVSPWPRLVSLVSPSRTAAPGPLRLNQRKISVFAFIPCSRLNAEHGTKLDTGYIIRVTRRHSAERRVVIDITFMRDHTHLTRAANEPSQ